MAPRRDEDARLTSLEEAVGQRDVQVSGPGGYSALEPEEARSPSSSPQLRGAIIGVAGVALMLGALLVLAPARSHRLQTHASVAGGGLSVKDGELPPPGAAPAPAPEPEPEPGSAAWWGKAEWRAREYLKGMTDKDKFAFVNGQDDKWPYHRHGYAGYINTQLSLPGYEAAYGTEGKAMPLALNDGPQGYNTYESYPGTATQFPALLSVAASFSPDASRRYAQAVAEEFLAKGANVLLGPDVEVQRAALTGRSFETISGEDPYLGSELVRPFVRTIQDHGIIVTVKHWLDNNQEIYRQTMNVEVGDRAQHEIYMPVFAAAFEAGAASVMCSYNKVYGVHACENKKLLTQLLREELGFKGYVVSDWGATHDAQKSAEAGLDVEMQGGPSDQYALLPDLVSQGTVTQETIDEKVVHVLSAMYAVGQFDGKFPVPQQYIGKNLWDLDKQNDIVIGADVTTDDHRATAESIIIESAVLLKNEDGALPLQTAGKTIAMVGKYCDQKMDKSYGQGSVYSGGGSGYVATKNEKVITPLQGMKDRVKDGKVVFSADASAAKGADYVVVCVAAHSEEGWDRANLTMPEADKLLDAVRKQGGHQKVIVLAIVPGAVLTGWAKHADAVLAMFMPGERVGPAVAKLLTGDASPGGRLPISFPKDDEQRFTKEQYPGVCPPPVYWCEELQANFSEGVLVGYRWNDAQGVPSAYPFGHGLAYTDFKFKGFSATCGADGHEVTVSLTVANTGKRDGAAVPQVYVGFKSLKPAVRQLRAFSKVEVAAGQEAIVSFTLGEKDWRFWDEASSKWVSAFEKGEKISVSVGASSADLKWTKKICCKATNVSNVTAVTS